MVVEKAVVVVTLDATQPPAQLLQTLQSHAACPSPNTVHAAQQDTGDEEPSPLTLSVVQRPQPRDPVIRPSSVLVLVDKELQRQQQEALALAAVVEAVPEEDKTRRGKRTESRQSTREKVAPASAVKKKTKTNRRAEVETDDAADEERVTVDLDDTLRNARWVVPAGGEVRICVRFLTLDVGRTDQPLSFEAVGSKRRYTVFLRGICEFPSIVRAPKTLFGALCREKAGSGRGYHATTGTLDFGPLLCGKSRDGFKTERYEANVVKVYLNNPGPADITVSAALESDTAFQTFTLDPPTCAIAAGAQSMLRVWAYPKTSAVYSDKVILCIKDNPAPVVFAVTVEGAEPALELERKVLAFERVLLHRKDTRTLVLRNKTRLAVAWALTGVEQLGDDFSAGALNGVIDPLQEYPLQITFKASRPFNHKKVCQRAMYSLEPLCICLHRRLFTLKGSLTVLFFF